MKISSQSWAPPSSLSLIRKQINEKASKIKDIFKIDLEIKEVKYTETNGKIIFPPLELMKTDLNKMALGDLKEFADLKSAQDYAFFASGLFIHTYTHISLAKEAVNQGLFDILSEGLFFGIKICKEIGIEDSQLAKNYADSHYCLLLFYLESGFFTRAKIEQLFKLVLAMDIQVSSQARHFVYMGGIVNLCLKSISSLHLDIKKIFESAILQFIKKMVDLLKQTSSTIDPELVTQRYLQITEQGLTTIQYYLNTNNKQNKTFAEELIKKLKSLDSISVVFSAKYAEISLQLIANILTISKKLSAWDAYQEDLFVLSDHIINAVKKSSGKTTDEYDLILQDIRKLQGVFKSKPVAIFEEKEITPPPSQKKPKKKHRPKTKTSKTESIPIPLDAVPIKPEITEVAKEEKLPEPRVSKDLTHLKSKITELTKSNTELKEEIKILTRKKEMVEEDNNLLQQTAKDVHSAHKKTKKGLKETIKSLGLENKKLKNEIELLKKPSATAIADQKELVDLRQTVTQLQQELKEKQSQYTGAEAYIKTLQTEITASFQMATQNIYTLVCAQDTVQKTQSQQRDELVAGLSARNEKLQQRLDELEKKLGWKPGLLYQGPPRPTS